MSFLKGFCVVDSVIRFVSFLKNCDLRLGSLCFRNVEAFVKKFQCN